MINLAKRRSGRYRWPSTSNATSRFPCKRASTSDGTTDGRVAHPASWRIMACAVRFFVLLNGLVKDVPHPYANQNRNKCKLGRWIGIPHRVIHRIAVRIAPACQADGVGLEVAAGAGVVVAVAVVVEVSEGLALPREAGGVVAGGGLLSPCRRRPYS